MPEDLDDSRRLPKTADDRPQIIRNLRRIPNITGYQLKVPIEKAKEWFPPYTKATIVPPTSENSPESVSS